MPSTKDALASIVRNSQTPSGWSLASRTGLATVNPNAYRDPPTNVPENATVTLASSPATHVGSRPGSLDTVGVSTSAVLYT